MSLLKNANANSAATPAFESDDATTGAATTAVAVSKPNAVAIAKPVDLNAMARFKDVMKVEYNTLDQIIATNGNFMDRETKTVLGDTVVFNLLSFQDSFVVSPNDEDAPDDTVRYSEDGVVCSDGTAVQAHLDWLKSNGFPKASLKQRAVVVAAIESAIKTEAFNGKLVQFDLSPSSRTMWKRHMANVAYGLSTNQLQESQVQRVKAETTLKQKGTDTYTQVVFSVAK